ncbi:MAG: 16S rRNA (guanine(527)-N(7))-methyltransferase RsmG, partial [Oscillibacter sp.]|nr:16S rRNA (guanine(527)-N(7))-methyltransferase RsmG [Oscillibacter sp.]
MDAPHALAGDAELVLRQGLRAFGLAEDRVPDLLRYADLLLARNRVMNLTAITEPRDVATLHFLDCAALLTLADFRGRRLIDVGTGAGFPGLVLKLLEPTLDLTLLDAQQKRVAFLEDACRAAGLSGAECVHARAEEFAAARRGAYDLAVSRAVA